MSQANEVQRVRVLLIGRQAGGLEVTSRLLQEAGFQVVSAADLTSAEASLQAGPWDLIVLDLDNGEQEGLDFAHRAKSDPARSWVPVMILTSAMTTDRVSRAMDLGSDEFMAKPFVPEEMVVRARACIRKGREERWLLERTRKLTSKVVQRDDELSDLRRFAQDIVSALPASLLVLDRELTVLFANERFHENRGLEPGRAAGRPLHKLLDPGALEGPLGEALRHTERTGENRHLARVPGIFSRTPERFWDVRISAFEYLGTRQLLLLAEEVTEHARADSEAAREKAKLAEVVNAVGAGLALIERDRTISFANTTFSRWFGEETPERTRREFWRSLSEPVPYLDNVFTAGKGSRYEFEFYLPDGPRRYFVNTLAPLHDPTGKVVQCLVLTNDVTGQQTRLEQFKLIRELSERIIGILDLEILFRTILVCATAGHALGFNRAFLFTRDSETGNLVGRMAVGPPSRAEAFRTWREISASAITLDQMLQQAEKGPKTEEMPLYPLVANLVYTLKDTSEIIVRTALEKRAQLVLEARNDPRVTRRFLEHFGAERFVTVPLMSRGEVPGVLLADNIYSGREITQEHVDILTLFATHAGLAIQNAEAVRQLRRGMKELRETQTQLLNQTKLATVGQLAAHVAHEIRNPLSAISMAARAILNKPQEAQRAQTNAQIIADEASRLENILRATMDFSRPAEPQPVVTDLNEIIRLVCERQSEEMAVAGIETFLDLDPSLPDFRFDPGQIQQVFLNLTKNAVESMPEGGKLFIRSRRRSECLEINLQDTGTGMPESVQERVFNPFFTTKEKGIGLGLAVCQRIIEEHGGEISVQSAVGMGTTFTILLPLAGPPSPALSGEPAPA